MKRPVLYEKAEGLCAGEVGIAEVHTVSRLFCFNVRRPDGTQGRISTVNQATESFDKEVCAVYANSACILNGAFWSVVKSARARARLPSCLTWQSSRQVLSFSCYNHPIQGREGIKLGESI